MVIDPYLAHRFIDTYMALLGTLVSDAEKQGKRPTQWLVIGRERFVDAPQQLHRYHQQHPRADAEMLDAIAALRVQRWIYLKDTTSYSVWLDERCEAAYGVLGLTDRLRLVAQGQSGVVVHAGVFPLQGRWVSDGLLEGPVLLGKNYRRSFTDAYNKLRRLGRFSLGPSASMPDFA